MWVRVEFVLIRDEQPVEILDIGVMTKKAEEFHLVFLTSIHIRLLLKLLSKKLQNVVQSVFLLLWKFKTLLIQPKKLRLLQLRNLLISEVQVLETVEFVAVVAVIDLNDFSGV